MTGVYNYQLVALSLIVAIIASYTALELGGRVSQSKGSSSWAWLLGGAFSMGTGIWSMHFIGMLAFRLPIAMAYDTVITILSMLIAVVVSGLALYELRRPSQSLFSITTGATLMGVGISTMHYTGMYAMQMFPPIRYSPPLFVASIFIAIVASLAALRIAFQLRHKHFSTAILAKLGSAILMGLAITGMHYTGMAAAQFSPDSLCLAVGSTRGIDNSALAFTIGVTTICILMITLGISALDAQFAAHTAKLANSLQAANEQLRNIALYDNLTGLPNRMALEDRMSQAVSRAQRNRNLFAVMFVDLDRFKPVNDSFGHGVGDELLKAVGQRLSACVRKSDTIARTGGDEFVVLLNTINEPQDAAMIGSKFLDELSRPFFISKHVLDISGSIGISIYPTDGKDVDVLKVNADVAMYHAKRRGRSNYCFFTPDMHTDAPEGAV